MELSAFDLSGKVALITGGAHGIGFSIAEGMARCGATICFNCSSQSSYEKGMAAYQAAGIEAHGYVADVTDWDAVSAMVDKIAAEVGPVDILVNNAGIIQRKPMLETSSEDFERVIKVHVVGAFNCSKAVLPAMIEKRAGKIINICSMMSELGRETVSGYAAAKGGLKMLTKNIASEFGQSSASTTSSATAWVPATSPPRRPRPCASASPTAAAAPSTPSSSPRPRPAAGARPRIWWAPASRPRIWWAPASFWPPTPPTLSTGRSSTPTAASWPIWATSRSKAHPIT